MVKPGADNERRIGFERLVAPWRDDLFRYVFWLCRDADLAEDVVQETMIRAFRSMHRLRDESAIKPWLLTIARREHARVYERKRFETRDIDELSQTDAVFIATSGDSDVDDMRDSIFRLEPEYREPLVLQVLMGFSTQEIADTMGLSQGAVLTRLHRARKKLMERVRSELDPIE